MWFILLFFYRFVRGYLCPDMKGLNEESISVLLTLLMIIGYLFIGILHGKMDEAYDRTISKTIQVVSSRYSLRVRVDTP